MSKFEAGDKVKILDSNCSPLKEGGVYTVHSVSEKHHWVMMSDPNGGYTYCFHDDCLELVEKKVMGEKVRKYKLETELSLQEVYQLHCLTGQLNNMTKVYMETERICVEELGYDFEVTMYDGNNHMGFQEKAEAIVKKGKRKVVVVGDREYYEDELQTALANIKPINL